MPVRLEKHKGMYHVQYASNPDRMQEPILVKR